MRKTNMLVKNEHLSHVAVPVYTPSHTAFDPSMTHLTEHATTISKYSVVPHKTQLLTHLIRRIEQNVEFHATLSSTTLSPLQRQSLAQILSRLRKKELFAVRMVEGKILALLEEGVIKVMDYRYVMHLLGYEKFWSLEMTAETFQVDFPIEIYTAETVLDTITVSPVLPTLPTRLYGDLHHDAPPHPTDLPTDQPPTPKLDFKSVVADVQHWITTHLEDPPKDPEQTPQKLSKYREPPRTLAEEMQRLLNVWTNTGNDRDYKRKVYSELFPPRSVVLSLEMNTGVQVQRLEESVLQTKGAESKFERKEYGAWYLGPGVWEKSYKSKFVGKERSVKSLEEDATRSFVRSRLDEIVNSLK